MKIIHLAFYALLFLLTSTVLYSQQSVSIQMLKEGGVWTLQGKANGAPMKFIFDPGASDVSISLTEARYLLKNNLMSHNDIVDYQKYQTASGNIEVGWKIILKKLEIGGLELLNVEASIANNVNAPILLGQTALKRLGVLTEDFSAGILVITPNKNNNSTASSGDNASGTYVSSSSNDNSSSDVSEYYKKLPEFSGDVSVLTYAPILQSPDMVHSYAVGKIDNNTVTILRKENVKYYYVRSGTVTGYLWVGWFK